jgi:hypothetical protein
MWAERGISRLFFNIVPTDTDAFVPPLHELEESLLVKVDVPRTNERPYGCFSVFIGGETTPFECPLQILEEVEVAGPQVGTVEDAVQALPTESGNTVDRCCCRVGSRICPASSNTLLRRSRTTARTSSFIHDCSTRPFAMFAGHALFRCPVFNATLRMYRLRDEGRTSRNKRGSVPVFNRPFMVRHLLSPRV